MKANLEDQSWFKRLFTNLNYKYKLVIMNESTFDEKVSFRISRMLVFIVFGLVTMVSIAFTIFMIYITPLKEYIPGYASVDRVRLVYVNKLKTDSLEHEIAQRDLWLENFQRRILLGEELEGDDSIVLKKNSDIDYSNIDVKKSPEDSILRAKWEKIPDYELSSTNPSANRDGISRFFFMAPVKGTVSSGFSAQKKHYGIDILCKKNEPVKACLDGIVIMSTWTYDYGYIIAVQHDKDIISVYKHNSALLKHEGDLVSAGDPIAIVGNTGKQTSGPHLHFEIWYNMNPVNAARFISFE